MLTLVWNLLAALHSTPRTRLPSNVIIDRLGSRSSRRRAAPVALGLALLYLLLTSICAATAQHDGLGSFNLLVLLFFWDSVKFFWVAVVAPLRLIADQSSSGRQL